MQLEKLNLLETRLNRLIDHFTQLREEKNVLQRSLEEKVGRLQDLETEVEELRRERDVIRERLSRLVDALERLETVETAGPGTTA